MIYSFGGIYDLDGNLAKGYNDHCKIVPKDNDWIMIFDGDFEFLTPYYGHVINEYIKRYPEYDLWTSYVNRVNCRPQLQKDMFYIPDIRDHKERAIKLYETKRYDVKPIVRVISGYCMIFKKSTWKKFPFRGQGVMGIDTKFSRDILKSGGKIGLMEAVYGFHYYRWNENTTATPYKESKMNEDAKKAYNKQVNPERRI